jgi:hypothetical protein
MDVATLTWFLVAACVAYVVAVDSNIYTWLVLLSKNATIWLQRQWYLVRHNPDSPWVRWEINRNANRLAREILKENKKR